MVPNLELSGITLSYRQFVLGGIIGQAILFQSFFEAAYGSFVRMYYQRIFQAMAVTPITLGEVLWGELLWDTSKASFASIIVLVIGVAIGDFSPLGAIMSLPVVFLGTLVFSASGLLAAAWAESIDAISYPQYLFVFPMFLFCGVFFPLSNLPPFLQGIAWVFPLTPILSIVRSFTLGLAIEWWAFPLLFFWAVLFIPLSRIYMMKRLVQ
jgi:lipooligosaccharide transport system permease protein